MRASMWDQIDLYTTVRSQTINGRPRYCRDSKQSQMAIHVTRPLPMASSMTAIARAAAQR